jgi:hypothetical protein
MNGRSQMQGGKNWILSKDFNETGSSETFMRWKSEPVLLNVYWAPELMQWNEFRQSM